MESGKIIKAALKICMQTLDILAFSSMLQSSNIDLEDITDDYSINLFHELSTCVVEEKYLLDFFQEIKSYAKTRHRKYKEVIGKMLNIQEKYNSDTPLLLAIRQNLRTLIKRYITLGADPHIKSRGNQGPLHITASLGYCTLFVYFWDVLQLDIDESDGSLRTPLHLAVLSESETVALFIIANTINIEFKDSKQMSPLHLSACRGNYRISRHLIVNGANRNIKDLRGNTPLSIAKLKGADNLYGLLVRIT